MAATALPSARPARAEALGYRNVHILAGGAPAWQRAGYTLYAGVNVPSKTFGELIEHERHTPRVTAQAVQAMRDAGEDFVIVDGRPLAEYAKMNIPGGICCPNGELALRIRDIVPDPTTKIVVNCAGRTRSIIGAQTLIDFGVPNPVYALENGTQGWFLAGLALEHGASRRYGDKVAAGANVAELEARARKLAGAHGVEFVARRRGQRLARGHRAHDLPPRCAHAGGVCGARRAGVRACAGRPADPGDGPVGRASGARGWCWSTRSTCAHRWWRLGCASSATQPTYSKAELPPPRKFAWRRPASAPRSGPSTIDGSLRAG